MGVRIDQRSKGSFINKRELRSVHVIDHQPRRAPRIEYRDNATGGRTEQIGQIVLSEPTGKSDALFGTSSLKSGKIEDLTG